MSHFPVQPIVGSPGDTIEEQTAQVALAGYEITPQVGRVAFDVGDTAGIADNFALQVAADGGCAGNAELLAGYEGILILF